MSISSSLKHDAEFLKGKGSCSDFSNQGLTRYRSAPSSFMAALLDCNSTDNNSSGGDESEALFSALLNPKSNGSVEYSPGKSGLGGSTVGMQTHHPVPGRNANTSTLMRQSSSPAGFFNGFGIMEGDTGNSNYRIQKANSSAAASSSSRFMPSIPENRHERSCTSATTAKDFEVFTHDSWNGSLFNTTLKRNRDGELKMFDGLEHQNTVDTKYSGDLTRHLSLPRTSTEIAEIEKYLQFQQDTTTFPCQVRAKRGCATHPRSIAERMRRTRISEKMKKLQDLFPDLDKQTNTADMLDMAVEYIKNLQKQVETLTEEKAKCVCPNKIGPAM